MMDFNVSKDKYFGIKNLQQRRRWSIERKEVKNWKDQWNLGKTFFDDIYYDLTIILWCIPKIVW